MLRVYFRNNRKLVSNISRLIIDMILSYYKASAGKEIQSAAVFAYQTYGDFIRFNPHYHSLILERGFDENLLSWKNSGFSIDNSIQLYSTDKKARESLAQYIAK